MKRLTNYAWTEHEIIECDLTIVSWHTTKKTQIKRSMSQNQPNQRGTLLTLWLVLMALANVVIASGYIIIDYLLTTNNSTLTNLLSRLAIPLWAIALFSIFSIVNLCSVIALLRWRKLGFFALCVSTLVGFTANIAMESYSYAIVGLFGIVILYLLLRSKWNLLR